MIYLDNAATTFPKPESVTVAVKEAVEKYGANPGRSGHRLSVQTAEKIYETREKLNGFFNGYGVEFVSFTSNCTSALNTAIYGILQEGDHAVISSLEHNSVVRPVNTLAENGKISFTVFSVGKTRDETVSNFRNALKPNTKLAVVSAVSNVFGTQLPLENIGKITKEKNIVFAVDGAQGTGYNEIDMRKMNIDCLCIPGHKGLYGPMGTGAVLHNGCIRKSLMQGGTGSDSFRLLQPETFPEFLESGTVNVPGILGLSAGLDFVLSRGVTEIAAHENELIQLLTEGLFGMENVTICRNETISSPLSFTVKNKHSEEVSHLLDEGGIAVRGGYHCAPLAHRWKGTSKSGTVRVSPGIFNTKKDINNLLNLLNKIAI